MFFDNFSTNKVCLHKTDTLDRRNDLLRTYIVQLLGGEWQADPLEFNLLEDPYVLANFTPRGAAPEPGDLLIHEITQEYVFFISGNLCLTTNKQGKTQTTRSSDWVNACIAMRPLNENLYARQMGHPTEITSGGSGVPEAPLDGQQYGRQDANWTPILQASGGGIPYITNLSGTGTNADPFIVTDANIPTPIPQGFTFLFKPTVTRTGDAYARINGSANLRFIGSQFTTNAPGGSASDALSASTSLANTAYSLVTYDNNNTAVSPVWCLHVRDIFTGILPVWAGGTGRTTPITSRTPIIGGTTNVGPQRSMNVPTAPSVVAMDSSSTDPYWKPITDFGGGGGGSVALYEHNLVPLIPIPNATNILIKIYTTSNTPVSTTANLAALLLACGYTSGPYNMAASSGWYSTTTITGIASGVWVNSAGTTVSLYYAGQTAPGSVTDGSVTISNGTTWNDIVRQIL